MLMPYLNNMINNILNDVWSLRSSNAMEITEVITPTIPIVILSFLLCIFLFWQPWKKTALPPGPRGLPIVGYLPFMEANFIHQVAELVRQYGPIYKMQMGSRLWVVVSSPSIVKELTQDQGMIFGNRDPTIAQNILFIAGHDISFAPHGSYWRNSRRIFVQELIRKSNIDASYDLRKLELRKAIKLLCSKVGRPIDIGQFMRTTTMDFVLTMVWGRIIEADELNKVGSEFRVLFQKSMDLMSSTNISDVFPLIARFDIQRIEKGSKAVLQSLEELFGRIINKSMEKIEARETSDGNVRKEGNTRKDFIQALLELRDSEEAGAQISMTQIKAILLGFLYGATDTTTTTAKSAMIEIVHNKQVMQKVQKELEDVVGLNNIVEDYHLPKLQYLDAVIKETLRLHPTVPLIPRRPSQSCTLAGYTIPKDTKVHINVWAIQRDPQLWENPLEFKPERFLNESGKWDFRGNSFEYLPFGSGRRVCPGIPLAERMLMYTLASLLHSFDWQSTETKEVYLSNIGNGKPFLAIPTIMRLPDSGLYT